MGLHQVDGIAGEVGGTSIGSFHKDGIVSQNKVVVVQLEISLLTNWLFSIGKLKPQRCLFLLTCWDLFPGG